MSKDEIEIEKMPAMLHCDDDDCVDGAELGKEAVLVVKAKLTGDSKSERDGKSHRAQSWEIQGISKKQSDDTDMDRFAKVARRGSRTE